MDCTHDQESDPGKHPLLRTHVDGLRTTGIDLSSRSGGTAICIIEWEAGTGRVESWVSGADDDQILAALGGTGHVAVDCPFGWPEAFVAGVSAQANHPFEPSGRLWPDAERHERDDRQRLRLRATETYIHSKLRITPLSVSSNWIALIAMRWAGIVDRWHREHGGVIDRTGAGRIVEVYPAAALKRWRLPHRGYKNPDHPTRSRELREEIVAGLGRRGSALEWTSAVVERCLDDHDALDALVCALVARAAQIGFAELVPGDLRDVAAREGWIVLPTENALDELGGHSLATGSSTPSAR